MPPQAPSPQLHTQHPSPPATCCTISDLPQTLNPIQTVRRSPTAVQILDLVWLWYVVLLRMRWLLGDRRSGSSSLPGQTVSQRDDDRRLEMRRTVCYYEGGTARNTLLTITYRRYGKLGDRGLRRTCQCTRIPPVVIAFSIYALVSEKCVIKS